MKDLVVPMGVLVVAVLPRRPDPAVRSGADPCLGPVLGLPPRPLPATLVPGLPRRARDRSRPGA